MDHTRYGVQLIAPLPIFDGLPGDRLIVRVGHPDPITLVRHLPPNYGALIDALERGTVLALQPHVAAGQIILALRALEGDRCPPPPRSLRRRWPAHLQPMR